MTLQDYIDWHNRGARLHQQVFARTKPDDNIIVGIRYPISVHCADPFQKQDGKHYYETAVLYWEFWLDSMVFVEWCQQSMEAM